MNIPDEIHEARILFEKAEKSVLPLEKHHFLKEAVEILDSYDEENPDELQAEKDLIRNMRVTYARRLLSQLTDIEEIDPETWIVFMMLFTTKLHNEISTVTKKDPDLKTKYNQFVKLWREEIIRALNL